MKIMVITEDAQPGFVFEYVRLRSRGVSFARLIYVDCVPLQLYTNEKG